jgi:glycosyltransferase involved in cell wall biosynthesis
MEPPFFTIVLPTYNRASMVGKAVDSIITQTYSNWELIIVDDGSIDNTRQVIEAYNEPRIKYIWQSNAERSAARNNGIDNAKGRYICFLDSDDYYLPNRLQQLHQELLRLNFPVAFLYTGLKVESLTGISNRPELKNTFNNILDFIIQAVIHSQQTCIEQSVIKDKRFNTSIHIGEDLEFWLRIVIEYPLIYLENQFTVVVVDHDDRTVNERKNNSYYDAYNTYKFIFAKNHPGNLVSAAIKRKMSSNALFGVARYYIYQSNNINAIYFLLKSILKNPTDEQTKYKFNLLFRSLYSIKKAEALLK